MSLRTMSGVEPLGRKSSEEERDFATELTSEYLEWSVRSFEFKSFAKTLFHPQPILITQGSYKGWDSSKKATPNPLLFALSRRFKFKVVAQCARIFPGYKCPVGPVFEIGDDFDGWFEILSEDGYPMFRIESVADLAEHHDKSFVVMKKMHAHTRLNDSTWMECDLKIGEGITVCQNQPTKVEDCGCGNLLKCRSFTGAVIYIPLQEAGSFCPSGEDYFTGPQKVSSLCSLRFPINVKLMEGSPPPADFPRFLPVMRLFRTEFEEVVTVWSMRKGDPLESIPTSRRLRVKKLGNLGAVRDRRVFNEILRHILSLLPQGKIRGQYLPRSLLETGTSVPQPFQVASLQKSTSEDPFLNETTAKSDNIVSSTTCIPSSTSGRQTLPSTDIPYPVRFGLFYAPTTHFSPSGISGSTIYFPHTTLRTTVSSPLTAVNTQRPSTCGSPSTSETYLDPSKEMADPSLHIHQPSSTSGLQRFPKQNFLQQHVSEYSGTLKSITSAESFKQSKSMGEPYYEMAPGLEQSKPSTTRIETPEQRGDQLTSALSDAERDKDDYSESKKAKGGPQTPTGVRRSLRIKAKELKRDEDSPGLAVAKARKIHSKIMTETGMSDRADIKPSSLQRSSITETPLKKDDDQLAPNLSPSEVISLLDSEDDLSSIDPYDEIDDIYEENNRLAFERSLLPLDEEPSV